MNFMAFQSYRLTDIYRETDRHDRHCRWSTVLPSNLRLITRECVHLVTRGQFWPRDKDDGHTKDYKYLAIYRVRHKKQPPKKNSITLSKINRF